MLTWNVSTTFKTKLSSYADFPHVRRLSFDDVVIKVMILYNCQSLRTAREDGQQQTAKFYIMKMLYKSKWVWKNHAMGCT